MPDLDGRKVWSPKTERIVTWLALMVVALMAVLAVLAFWRLRG